MMRAWVVTQNVDYEGAEVIGLAATIPAAKELVREHLLYISGDKLKAWVTTQSNERIAQSKIHNSYYALNRMSVWTQKDLKQ
jgi:hypothetical protein